MSEIRTLTRNGDVFFPLTHSDAVIGMNEFRESIMNQVENYRPIEITGNVTNAPDEEDITSSNNLLKFKDRNNLYGLGKVILRRGSTFSSQVTLQNTIYVVQYGFDLNNGRVVLPSGAILLFEGGSISNGTLVGSNTRLVYYQDLADILTDITLEGTFIHKACDKDTVGSISVDNSSIEFNSLDQISVRNSGIQNTHLNGSVVDQTGIVLDTNNKISIKDNGVTNFKIDSSVVNTEDLSLDTNHKIKLADRTYNSINPDGLGRIILRKNLIAGVNTLVQSMINQVNTIYVIRYDYTLGEDITIPANCVLEFDGGSVSANGEGKEVITLNGSKINAQGKVFTGIKFLNEEGVYLRTSWWGFGNNMQNASSMLGNIINAAKTKGVVVVDSDIYIETPIQIDNMLETVIVGENNGKIISSYSPNSGESLITLNMEACIVKDVHFEWNLDNAYTSLNGSNVLLKCNTRFSDYPDLDVDINHCSLSTNANIKLLMFYGRGVKLSESMFYCSEENKSNGSLVLFHAKSDSAMTDVFYKPEDAGRGIVIQNNRFHAAINKYILDFTCDGYPSFVYVNTQILNNHSDGGGLCIQSSANHRGLQVIGNTFMGYTPNSNNFNFNLFVGNVDGLLFANNIIGGPKDSEYCCGESYFEDGTGTKKYKNIKFVNNIYDAKKMAFVCLFSGKTVNPLVSIENISISGNTFSDNCFIGGSGSSKVLLASINNSLNNIRISDNSSINSNLVAAVFSKDNSGDASSADNIIISNNFGVATPIYNETDFNTRFSPTNVVKENNF